MLNSRDLADRQVIAAVREHARPLPQALHDHQTRAANSARLASHLRAQPSTLPRVAIVRYSKRFSPSSAASLCANVADFRRRRGRRKKLVEIEQPLRPIPVHEWQRKNYPDEWHRYFRYELILEWNRHWQPYWVFRQPSLYELKIERNWLWYFREVDPVVEHA